MGRVWGEGKRYTQFHHSYTLSPRVTYKWEEALLIQCFPCEQEKPALDLQNPGERANLRQGLVIPAPDEKVGLGHAL